MTAARRRGRAAAPAATVLSVDWDFFLWRGAEARAEDAWLEVEVDGRPQTVHALHLFDWGHSENHSPALQVLLWQVRRDGFERVGVDAEEVTGYRGGVSPGAFCCEVGARLRLGPKACVAASDSHCRALGVVADAARKAGGPVRVVHFDAHHDCGYGGLARLRAEARRGEADCGSWLWHAARVGLVSSVEVVYPDWRDAGQEGRPAGLGCAYDATSWSAWLAGSGPAAPVAAAHVARSGAWTPPWHDRKFLGLVGGLADLRAPGGRRGWECLDCADGRRDPDVCQVRDTPGVVATGTMP